MTFAEIEETLIEEIKYLRGKIDELRAQRDEARESSNLYQNRVIELERDIYEDTGYWEEEYVKLREALQKLAN